MIDFLAYLKNAIKRMKCQPRKRRQRVLLVVLVVYIMQQPAMHTITVM